MMPAAVGNAGGREHARMQTLPIELQRPPDDDEDEAGEDEGADTPPAPDEEPDGEPDPAFD
jgi:hypothetical protein